MRPEFLFRAGDEVYVTYERQTVEGIVKVASPNGRSLFVVLERLVKVGPGFFTGLGLLLGDDGKFRDLIFSREAVVTPRPCPPSLERDPHVPQA